MLVATVYRTHPPAIQKHGETLFGPMHFSNGTSTESALAYCQQLVANTDYLLRDTRIEIVDADPHYGSISYNHVASLDAKDVAAMRAAGLNFID